MVSEKGTNQNELTVPPKVIHYPYIIQKIKGLIESLNLEGLFKRIHQPVAEILHLMCMAVKSFINPYIGNIYQSTIYQ